jgi:hypothetical protein
MIQNLIYFISIFDFLIHYALMIEMNVFEQMYQLFGKVNSTAIPLCEIPIKKYLPFSLSEISLYILYLSILTLLISIEAGRKSSIELYRFYVIIKFIFAISSLIFCTLYTLVNRQMSFISTSVTIPHEIESISITIDSCLVYAREKMATCILSIVNVFVFLMSIECSKFVSLLKIKYSDIY